MLGLGDDMESGTLGIGTVIVESRYNKLKRETGVYLKQITIDSCILASDKIKLPESLHITIYRNQYKKSFWSKEMIDESDREFEIRSMRIYNKAMNKYVKEHFRPKVL